MTGWKMRWMYVTDNEQDDWVTGGGRGGERLVQLLSSRLHGKSYIGCSYVASKLQPM